MSNILNKTDRAKYDRLKRGFTKNPDEYQLKLIQFSEDMDDKYGKHMSEIKGFNKGGMAKKKKLSQGGVTMKGKTKMAKKMMRGGSVAPKRAAGGGMMKMAKKKRQRGGSVMSAVAKNKNPAASANMRKDLANYSKAAAAAKPGARKGNTSPGKRMMRGGMAKKK